MFVRWSLISLSLLAALLMGSPARAEEPADSPLYSFTLPDLDGKPQPLSAYRGKALLLVNVASKCGFTPQYAGLEKLSREYAKQGLVVLGFPANDFRQQEPGTDAEIKAFCTANYGVTFPMFSKISVTGEKIHPLYRWLTESSADSVAAGPIEWNFTKFVLDRQGRVIARFPSRVAPESAALRAALSRALAS